MWVHEIYGFRVTERELEAALKIVVRRPWLADGDRDRDQLRRTFQDAIDHGRTYERHGDVHMDGPDAYGL